MSHIYKKMTWYICMYCMCEEYMEYLHKYAQQYLIFISNSFLSHEMITLYRNVFPPLTAYLHTVSRPLHTLRTLLLTHILTGSDAELWVCAAHQAGSAADIQSLQHSVFARRESWSSGVFEQIKGLALNILSPACSHFAYRFTTRKRAIWLAGRWIAMHGSHGVHKQAWKQVNRDDWKQVLTHLWEALTIPALKYSFIHTCNNACFHSEQGSRYSDLTRRLCFVHSCCLVVSCCIHDNSSTLCFHYFIHFCRWSSKCSVLGH